MTTGAESEMRTLLAALLDASDLGGAEAAIVAFESAAGARALWVPVGRENNRGTIDAAADPGRSLVERLTNSIDAVLEYEHGRHNGRPDCRSPREAAAAWLNVPDAGLSALSQAQRQALAQRVTIRVSDGDGKELRIVDVTDTGIGLRPEQMPSTILSLNESNKTRKLYVAGAYGQGGSSTFAVSRYTLVASLHRDATTIGFTVVKFLETPLEVDKLGHYVYLTHNGSVLTSARPDHALEPGTFVRHVGYDLSDYAGAFGPRSVYGLLNRVLFDPVLPVWLENQSARGQRLQRRSIVGARNSLNTAWSNRTATEADDETDQRRTSVVHASPTSYVNLGEFGRLGVEYWVLQAATQPNPRPSEAFVTTTKPIVMTHNGQNHGELSQLLIRREAELPYLATRMVVHLDCNSLSPAAKKLLFVANREDVRRGQVKRRIEDEVVLALRADTELTRLNREARRQNLESRDETAREQMRREVTRLLRTLSTNVPVQAGAEPAPQPSTPRPPRPAGTPRGSRTPREIPIEDPPTYVRIVWDEERPIPFFPQQRRYVRVETNAPSTHHNAAHPTLSRFNFIASCPSVEIGGSTPLNKGRMSVIVSGASNANAGEIGTIRVELTRPGLPVLLDEHAFEIVAAPPAREADRRAAGPDFNVSPVAGLDDPMWVTLEWPQDANAIACSAEMEGDTLQVWYSTIYPAYANAVAAFERRDPALAQSFTSRYEIWLAVHSLLFHEQETAAQHPPADEVDQDFVTRREREERNRIATLAAMFAAREIANVPADGGATE